MFEWEAHWASLFMFSSIVYSDARDLGVGGVVKDHEGVILIFRGLLMKCFAAIFVSLVFP